MGTKPSEVQILFHRRNAKSRGQTSSNAQNDMMEEVSHDLLSLSEQINSSIIPALSTLADGTPSLEIDAFANGIDGRSIYANSTAGPDNDVSFFNLDEERPYTIYEELTSLYTTVSGLQTDLTAQLDAFSRNAEDVVIADVGGLYASAQVEAALTEVMEKVNLIALGQIDLTAVHDHYVPVTANTFDIGTAVVALRNIYTNSLYLRPTTAPTAVAGAMYWDSSTSKLMVYNGSTWKEVAFV